VERLVLILWLAHVREELEQAGVGVFRREKLSPVGNLEVSVVHLAARVSA
jgi:hypothetical protein